MWNRGRMADTDREEYERELKNVKTRVERFFTLTNEEIKLKIIILYKCYHTLFVSVKFKFRILF